MFPLKVLTKTKMKIILIKKIKEHGNLGGMHVLVPLKQ